MRLKEIQRSQRNRYFAAALAGLDEYGSYQRHLHIANDAAAMLKDFPYPAPVADLVDTALQLDEWLDAKVQEREAKVRGAEFRISVLSTLEVNSSQRCEYIVQRSVNSMLSHLHSTLVELLDQVRDASTALHGATSAQTAIVAGTEDAWRTLLSLADDYDELRAAQNLVLGALNRPDELYKRQSRHSADQLASDMLLSNLDDIWPDWRQPGQSAFQVQDKPIRREPWPQGRVEQLIWLATSSAQAWIPTPAELSELDNDRKESSRQASREAHTASKRHRRPGPRSGTGMVVA